MTIKTGVLHDFGTQYWHGNGVQTVAGMRNWLRDNLDKVMFHSSVIVRKSVHVDDLPYFNNSGLYFLIMCNEIVYVGQSINIGNRLNQYIRERRPFRRVAVIAGLPKSMMTEIEYAYIHRMNPSWNSEDTRCGNLYDLPELTQAASKLDCRRVLPYYTPTLDVGHREYKGWELAVIGLNQQLKKHGHL